MTDPRFERCARAGLTFEIICDSEWRAMFVWSDKAYEEQSNMGHDSFGECLHDACQYLNAAIGR